MKFYVKATQLREGAEGDWLEAHEDAASLADALALVQQWAEGGEVEPYGHGEVTFSITCTPDGSEQPPASPTWGPWGAEGRQGV